MFSLKFLLTMVVLDIIILIFMKGANRNGNKGKNS